MVTTEVFMARDFDNILDYLFHYGDLTFREEPFNDVDHLIFAALAYFPLEDFERNGKDFEPKTIQDICIDYISSTSLKCISHDMPDWMRKTVFLAMALLKKKRFCNIKLTHFFAIFSQEQNTQFAGLCFKIGHNNCEVSFRGTDNSWLGFKEDFHLSCYESVPAQNTATEFLSQCMKDFPSCHFGVTGHSKGGCLAVYSAAMVGEKEQKRIQKVINFDGPGISLKTRLSAGYERIQNKISIVVVRDDLVGGLMNTDVPTYIVDDFPYGNVIRCHDLYNWKIDKKDFVKVPSVSSESKFITTTINKWLNYSMTSVPERIQIIDALFDAINETEFNTPGKVIDDPIPFFIQFYRSLSKEKANKKLLTKALKMFGADLLNEYFEYLRSKKKQKELDKEFMKGQDNDEQ